MSKSSFPAQAWVIAIVLAMLLSAGGGRGLQAGEQVTVKNQKTAAGCVTDQVSAEVSLRQAVQALDRLRDKVEEWGVVTISQPVAVLDHRAFYVPPDIVPPEKLYEDARTDVGATTYQTNEAGFSNELDVAFSPLAAAGGELTKSMTTKKEQSGGGEGDTKKDESTSVTAEQTLVVPPDLNAQFGDFKRPFESLKEAAAPKKSVAAALREAQDNTIRQKIYTQMTYPKRIKGHSCVIFAIVQVSCNPGWRTQQHYIADCSANLEYYDLHQSKLLSRSHSRAPTVFSVLPLIDAQTIEMANSQREITQLAFKLAASLPAHGVKVDANDVMKFVRRYAKDMRSVSPIPVVNSYSSGGTFGFRFSPSFQAERDPAARKSRAANVLVPTTFPALITVILHESDLRFAQANLEAGELGLMTHISTRWYLKDRPPLWQFPKRLFRPMKRDTAAMEVGAAGDVQTVYDAKSAYERFAERTNQGRWDSRLAEVRRQILALETKGVGRDWPISFPPRKSGEELFPPSEEHAKANDAMQAREDAARQARDAKKRPPEPEEPEPALEVGPINLTPANEKEKITLFVSGEKAEQAKSARFGGSESVDSIDINGGSIVVRFVVGAFSDGDKRTVILLNEKGGEIARKEAAVTLHKPKEASLNGPARASRVAFEQRFGMETQQTALAGEGFDLLPVELSIFGQPAGQTLANLERPSFPAHSRAEEIDALLPPLPVR